MEENKSGTQIIPVHEYVDSDCDTWIDGVKKVIAKYSGGLRDIKSINCIVVHRLATGRGESGPNYVSKKDLDRKIAWHVTIHNDEFSRRITQHLPLNHITWNAGNKRINSKSISIEFDAAKNADPHGKYDDLSIQTAIDFILACKKICPNLRYIVGHCDIVPDRRVDPGKLFPWAHVCSSIGLQRVRHEKINII